MIEQLISAARDGVDARRSQAPQADLESQLHGRGEDRPFSEALVRPGLSLIAEFKRRSPSAGEIAEATADVTGQVGACQRARPGRGVRGGARPGPRGPPPTGLFSAVATRPGGRPAPLAPCRSCVR